MNSNHNTQQKTENRQLTIRIAVIICLLVAGTVGLCWILNTTLLGKYYQAKKVKSLSKNFEILSDAGNNGILYDQSYDVVFENMAINGNITVLIFDEDGVKRSIVKDSAMLRDEFMSAIIGNENAETMVDTDSYKIMKKNDARLGSEYLVLVGALDNGDMILMRTPLEGIRESVSIANGFLLIVGLIVIVIAGIVGIVIAGRITRLNEANLKLRRDIEEKEEIDNMRKEFISNVSHELKTPLAIIRGYSEGLAECVEDDPENSRYYCDVIVDESEKMNRMVSKLLKLNKLEFGNESIEIERFNLSEMIEGIISSTSILVENRDITVKNHCPEDVFAMGDPYNIEEVITNYLSNAINHVSEPGNIEVRCTTSDDKVRIGVFNTGKPIANEDMERIWEKFYKADKAHSREYGGSGIGLSIVKAIMDAHGGKYGADNYSDGVEFWFELNK